jgi:hypothetical protein
VVADHAGDFDAARDGKGPKPRIMFNRATGERLRAERR